MQERILPYKSFAYERDLIEYAGTLVYVQEGFPEPLPVPKQYTSPGATIYTVATGSYVIYLDDKVPIWNEILNGVPSEQNLTALDQGFGATIQCMTQLRAPGTLTDTYHIQNSSAYFVTPGEKQIAFKVFTHVNGVLANLPWCFRILISGQPAKFVQGLGA